MSRGIRFPDTGSPDKRAPGVAAGITEDVIHDLVHRFYAKVRRDAVLGPIFESKVDDWPAHLAKLCAFWSSVTLMSGRYKGTPMAAHIGIPSIERAHFGRWLELFQETARETCEADAAALFTERAERIAQSLQIGIALHRSGGRNPQDAFKETAT